MNVTSVTSPIGLWTAARKPIVSNRGSAILKISGACREKNEHGFYLYGHEADSWTDEWAGPTAERGRCDWLPGLDLKDIGQSTCQSQRSHVACFIVKYKIREAKISQMNTRLH